MSMPNQHGCQPASIWVPHLLFSSAVILAFTFPLASCSSSTGPNNKKIHPSPSHMKLPGSGIHWFDRFWLSGGSLWGENPMPQHALRDSWPQVTRGVPKRKIDGPELHLGALWLHVSCWRGPWRCFCKNLSEKSNVRTSRAISNGIAFLADPGTQVGATWSEKLSPIAPNCFHRGLWTIKFGGTVKSCCKCYGNHRKSAHRTSSQRAMSIWPTRHMIRSFISIFTCIQISRHSDMQICRYPYPYQPISILINAHNWKWMKITNKSSTSITNQWTSWKIHWN